MSRNRIHSDICPTCRGISERIAHACLSIEAEASQRGLSVDELLTSNSNESADECIDDAVKPE